MRRQASRDGETEVKEGEGKGGCKQKWQLESQREQRTRQTPKYVKNYTH